jgi:tetratricopeptide (TPR) repeat protein
MDWGFIRPKRAGDRSLAYAQAEWTAEYIIDRWGYRAILAMLRGFADGLSQSEVFAEVLETDEAQFNRDFRRWAREQVSRWGFRPDGPPSLARARARVALPGAGPDAHAALAEARLEAGQLDPARASAERALELAEDHPDALAVLARVAIAQDQWDQARDYARRLEQARAASALAARVLAEAALRERQFAQAVGWLEKLKIRRPLDPWSYQQLANIYTGIGQGERALPNLIEINRHNMRDPIWPKQIAEIYRRMGDRVQAETFYRQALWINPYDATVYQTLAASALREGDYDQAVRWAECAVAAGPDAARAHAVLAQVCFHAGRNRDDEATLRRGLAAAERALELDPASQARQIADAIGALLER